MKKLMLVAALGLVATQAAAQDKLKVGFLTTLSGPPAALGVQRATASSWRSRHSAASSAGARSSSWCRTTNSKPDVAVGKAKAFVERDKVDFVVGPIFSNILTR